MNPKISVVINILFGCIIIFLFNALLQTRDELSHLKKEFELLDIENVTKEYKIARYYKYA